MTVQIGAKYLSLLANIKQYLLFIHHFEFITEPELQFEYRRGHCCYFDCPDKTLPSNERITIIRNRKLSEIYNFHSSCIEQILNDERIPSLN